MINFYPGFETLKSDLQRSFYPFAHHVGLGELRNFRTKKDRSLLVRISLVGLAN